MRQRAREQRLARHKVSQDCRAVSSKAQAQAFPQGLAAPCPSIWPLEGNLLPELAPCSCQEWPLSFTVVTGLSFSANQTLIQGRICTQPWHLCSDLSFSCLWCLANSVVTAPQHCYPSSLYVGCIPANWRWHPASVFTLLPTWCCSYTQRTQGC